MVCWWTLLRPLPLLQRVLLTSSLRPRPSLLRSRWCRLSTRSWRTFLDVSGTWKGRSKVRGGLVRRNRLQGLNTTLWIAVLWHPKALVTFDCHGLQRRGMYRHALLVPRAPCRARFHPLPGAAQARPQTPSGNGRVRRGCNLLRWVLRLWRMPLLPRPLQRLSQPCSLAGRLLRPLCPLRSPES